MGQRRKQPGAQRSAGEQEMRNQEVVRANRELAAYFKGRRTEREARAALKIIKAFVRDRERRDAKNRPPLPGAAVTSTPNETPTRKAASAIDERHRRKRRHKSKNRTSGSLTPSIESPANAGSPEASEFDERTPERHDVS